MVMAGNYLSSRINRNDTFGNCNNHAGSQNYQRTTVSDIIVDFIIDDFIFLDIFE
jgi:hypothetical protein